MASSEHGDAHAREIAAGLVAAVRTAIGAARGPGAPGRAASVPAGGVLPGTRAADLAWAAAADVAELLELPGLAALLNACANASAPGRDPGPAAAVPLDRALDRLARLVGETESSGDVRAFTLADRELASLAHAPGLGEGVKIAAARAAPTGAPTFEAPSETEDVRSLSELLADFAFDDAAAVAKAMVSLPVAAGLRAALEWIGADTGGRMHAEVQDAALTLVARAAHEPGLGPAGAVLWLTGGALVSEPDGRWSLRVPLHAARPAFLLARQGELSLAIPWHAVARLRITDEAARDAMTEPSLQPWSPLARAHGERPAALLALGLASAWLHLDHIVWRVFARPEPAEAVDEVPGGRQVVRTEEGEEFRVLDLERALEGVPPLETPPPVPRVRAEARAALAEPAPQALPAHAAAAPVPPLVLGPEFVRALGGLAMPAPKPAMAAPAARRALIVDDSLVARMELGRVLERRGWEVEWVETAAEMWSMLTAGGWNVVFVDVSLPDARGRAHLKTLAAQQAAAPHRFELVALTRDEADERMVLEVGIARALRKPFAPGVVERVVGELPGRQP